MLCTESQFNSLLVRRQPWIHMRFGSFKKIILIVSLHVDRDSYILSHFSAIGVKIFYLLNVDKATSYVWVVISCHVESLPLRQILRHSRFDNNKKEKWKIFWPKKHVL